MGTVRSDDGTTIAFDAWGDGQPLIMIDGATVELFMTAAAGIPADEALADLLPTASLQAVKGEQHIAEADVLAPALRQFTQGH